MTVLKPTGNKQPRSIPIRASPVRLAFLCAEGQGSRRAFLHRVAAGQPLQVAAPERREEVDVIEGHGLGQTQRSTSDTGESCITNVQMANH